MKAVSSALVCIASTALSYVISDAAPIVQAFQYNGTGTLVHTDTFDDPDFDDIMTIDLQDATRSIIVVPLEGTTLIPDTSGQIDVGKLRFDTTDIPTNAANRTINVSVGDFFAGGINTLGLQWGKFWGGIETPSAGGQDDARVTIRLCACVGNSIAGPVDVEELVRLETGTEIKAPVHAGLALDGVTRIEAKQIFPAGDITIDSGNVYSVIALGRDENPAIEGDITLASGNLHELIAGTQGSGVVNGTVTGKVDVTSGSIDSAVAYNGSIIGPASTTSTPNYRVIAKNGIGSIEADSIDCDIITNSGNPTGADLGYLRQLTTSSGDLKGRLTTRGIGIPNSALPFGVNISRDLIGMLDVIESVQSAAGAAAITIGRDLTPGSVIRIRNSLNGNTSDGGIAFTAASGLKGQTIVNSNLNSSQWLGDVAVGSTLELHPDSYGSAAYTTPSSDVGGGAVGTVPYRLYKSDCAVPGRSDGVPANGQAFYVVQSQMDAGLDLRFYGPVKEKVSGLPPLRLFKPFSGTGGQAFIADLTCITDQVVAPIDVPLASRARTVRVKTAASRASFPVGYYRLTSLDVQDSSVQYRCDTDDQTPDPARTTLVCDLATNASGVAPGVAYFDVYFYVIEDCNQNGVADQGEYYGCGGACPADIDDGSMTCTPDQGVDINDLLMFPQAFENGDLCADLTDQAGGNPDQGVDINDLLFFLAHFEMGC